MTDKVTADEHSINYYVTGAYEPETLAGNKYFTIGDGKIYGGFINYPVLAEEIYSWAEVSAVWYKDKPTVLAYFRDVNQRQFLRDDKPLLAGGKIKWWFILLALLLALLLLLLCCCLCYWCTRRFRRRSDRHRVVHTTQQIPIEMATDKGKGEINAGLLESRIEDLRSNLDSKLGHHYYHREADRESSINSDDERRKLLKGKGDFEEGYLSGYKDASKITGGTARRRLDEDYSGTRSDFHSGYAQGLRDAGLQGMSQSMHDLAAKRTGNYSSGYTHGFRDGVSGVYGDRLSTAILQRLEEQFPTQDDYKHGYIEGFKDATSTQQETVRTHVTERNHMTDRITEISERLSTLERPVHRGSDEVHTTKVYHVYNQLPEGYSFAGQQLAQELDQLESSSRRSTLRRHYTPGDYLKYPSDTESSAGRRTRRSMSASNVARDHYHHQRSGQHLQSSDHHRRYHYRSRSDLGDYVPTSPKRLHASTTLSVPGGHSSGAGGYGSRTMYASTSSTQHHQSSQQQMQQTARSTVAETALQFGGSKTQLQQPSSTTQSHSRMSSGGGYVSQQQQSFLFPPATSTPTAGYPVDRSQSFRSTQSRQFTDDGNIPAADRSMDGKDGSWTDELMRIVREPMNHTLDRMKRYNTSLSQLPPSPIPVYGGHDQ